MSLIIDKYLNVEETLESENPDPVILSSYITNNGEILSIEILVLGISSGIYSTFHKATKILSSFDGTLTKLVSDTDLSPDYVDVFLPDYNITLDVSTPNIFNIILNMDLTANVLWTTELIIKKIII